MDRQQETLNDKKQKIIEAAVSVFSKKGFESSKVEDITQKAGIAKGTFYLYFDSKESVYQEMMKKFFDSYKERCVAAKELSFLHELEFHIDFYFDIVEKDHDFVILLFKTWPSAGYESNEVIRKLAQEHNGRHKEVIRDLIQKGLDRKELVSSLPIETLTMMMISLFDGLVANLMIYPEWRNRKEEFKNLFLTQWGLGK